MNLHLITPPPESKAERMWTIQFNDDEMRELWAKCGIYVCKKIEIHPLDLQCRIFGTGPEGQEILTNLAKAPDVMTRIFGLVGTQIRALGPDCLLDPVEQEIAKGITESIVNILKALRAEQKKKQTEEGEEE